MALNLYLINNFNVSKPIEVNKSNFKKLKTYVNKTIFDLVYDLCMNDN